MSKSLQDQLRALGLANEKAKQAAGGKLSLDKAYALRQQEEKKQANTSGVDLIEENLFER